MAKLSELIKKNHTKTMVYGEGGTGKTTLAATFPGPVYFLDFDNKLEAAWDFWKDSKPGLLDTVEGDRISMAWDTGKPYDQFQKCLTELEQLVRSGSFRFKTVVLDSFTFYSKAVLGKSMTIASHKRATAGKPSFDDYAFISKQFLSDMGRLFDLPCNFLGIGHIKKTIDETSGVVTHTLLFDGNASSGYAPKLFQEVYRSFVRMENGKPIYYLQTKPDGKYECRSSIKAMPPVIPMSFEDISKHQQPKGTPQ